MADSAPAALVEAMEARRRRRRNRSQWQILPSESASAETFAASINQARHQRLSNAFKPEGWITEY